MISCRRWILRGAVVCSLVLLMGADPKTKKGPDLELTKDEQTILDLTNREREKAKLPPLKANATLCEVARAHSANMASKGELKHVLDDKNPAQRIKAAGYKYRGVGENIASGRRISAADAFQLWMDSPHHKENIMQSRFQEIGIGIQRASDGEIYFTQVFGTPWQRR